jgi:hypothetical protein
MLTLRWIVAIAVNIDIPSLADAAPAQSHSFGNKAIIEARSLRLLGVALNRATFALRLQRTGGRYACKH